MSERTPSTIVMDNLELSAGGYKRETPRQFSLWSLGSLSFSLTCTWLGTGSSIGIALTESSSAGALWTFPIDGPMTVIVASGMAELASAYPVAVGQYYWAFMVAGDGYKAVAAFMNAWVAILHWWLGSASVSNFIASMTLEIAGIWYPDYELQHWHQYLVFVTLVWLAVAINVFASGWIPMFNKLIFGLSVVTLSATTLSLFIVARNHHASADRIFTDTTIRSGWTSARFVFVLAVGNAIFSYLGSDCGAHMCEEIPNPGKNVPRIIVVPLLVGFLTAFPFASSLMYAITDLKAVLNTPAGLPLIELYRQGTGSQLAASILLAFFAFCFFATTSSRTIWAVSRDDALLYSDLWMRVHPTFKMPANAMLLFGACITADGAIFIGLATAFSTMVSAAIVFQQTSCIIPQAILLYRGRERVLPERHFNLDRFGAAINAVAIAWVVFLDVLYCFPTAMPVTPQNMSFVSLVSVGLVAFVSVLWMTTKRKVFKGPQIDYDPLKSRRTAAIHSELEVVEPDIVRSVDVESVYKH